MEKVRFRAGVNGYVLVERYTSHARLAQHGSRERHDLGENEAAAQLTERFNHPLRTRVDRHKTGFPIKRPVCLVNRGNGGVAAVIEGDINLGVRNFPDQLHRRRCRIER